LRPLVILISLLIVSIFASAQIGNYFDKFSPAKKWSVGYQIGPTAFQGDAAEIKLGMASGGHVKYSVSHSFALKLNANFGTLKGGRFDPNIGKNGNRQYNTDVPGGTNVNDPGNQAPGIDNYTFLNNFREVNINTVFTLGNISFLQPVRKTQVFLFLGFGAIWSNVVGNWGSGELPNYENINPRPTYEGRNFSVPFGVGIKRNYSPWLDLGLEFRENWNRSDNLDAFSFNTWRNRTTDYYTVLTLQASIKLGTKGRLDHYDWINPIESIYETMDSFASVQTKVNAISQDQDNDGVSDYFDKEPESENNIMVYGSGVVVDSDRDGVPDFKDDQIFTEKGAPVNEKGVMDDADNDGVPDYRDEDPTTPAGSGVTPTGRAIKSGGGCCDCEDLILPAIIFDEGSAKVKPEFYGVLYSVASKMKECPDLKIVTAGYSLRSKSGEQISWKRSNAVIDVLNKEYGVSRDRFIIDYNAKKDATKEYNNRRIDLKKAGANEKGTSNPPAPFPGSK
jgi:outer membrane protein OmpA-like peptidoglycan-associated protein